MNNDNFDKTLKTQQDRKTVLVGGCFDLIHYGHIKFLEEAKKHGTKLVVLLESDETIQRLKGAQRPFHNQEQRKEMLESLRCVDEVIMMQSLEKDEEYMELIKKIQPDVIALTEGDPILHKKMRQTELVGAEAIVIPKVHAPSTTSLSKLAGLG